MPQQEAQQKNQEKNGQKMPILTLDKLTEEPYTTIICYPKANKTELKKRLNELRKLGITALEFTGQKQILNTQVLGKGCVGIVTIAHRKNEKTALKIRRTDADRESMLREAKLLKKANKADVGPKLMDASKNFLIMQFIEGELLPKWFEKRVNKTRAKKVLRDILEQCWRLDKTHLDHGELSHAPKHIIIDKEDKPVIVDFETASVNRRPSNVTSICQFLFISKAVPKPADKLDPTDKRNLVNALKRYKNDMNHENFAKVLESCGLQAM
jgi:putative serine/threonine protein kinase